MDPRPFSSWAYSGQYSTCLTFTPQAVFWKIFLFDFTKRNLGISPLFLSLILLFKREKKLKRACYCSKQPEGGRENLVLNVFHVLLHWSLHAVPLSPQISFCVIDVSFAYYRVLIGSFTVLDGTLFNAFNSTVCKCAESQIRLHDRVGACKIIYLTQGCWANRLRSKCGVCHANRVNSKYTQNDSKAIHMAGRSQQVVAWYWLPVGKHPECLEQNNCGPDSCWC